ncbi:hypothetical protein B0H12DRAFT_192230 [Mycena haematopus]|nr:hypothetical protein B0H12DRAFT_192230 [Mycena haematopus]
MSLFEAARRGGFLAVDGGGPGGVGPEGGAGSAHEREQQREKEQEQQHLMSGTGLAQVNRLVAELDRRRSRSATPSPGGTPPVSPTDGHAYGRASPSLLGPALVRIAEAEAEAEASGGVPYGESAHAHGRASPLLPLGIAVDEVDKERRRRSADFGVLGGGAGVLGGLEEDERLEEEGDPHSGPSSQALYDRAFPASAPATSVTFPFSSTSAKRSLNAPVRAYADDDDDAELFPLPSRSSSRGTPSPRATPPRGSPAASASDVNVNELSIAAGGKRPPKAGALLPVALTGAARERDFSGGAPRKDGTGTPPLSPLEMKKREGERSRSEAVCVALGSMGRREREMRERERGRELEREREAGKVAKCSLGLLLPPGDERECSDSSHSNSNAGSREGSVERGSTGSDADSSERRDLEKPLPVLPRLATSVLAAGPYSPALAPRTYKTFGDVDAVQAEGQAQGQGQAKSNHFRGASAPAGVTARDASQPPPIPTATPIPIATPTPTHQGRAKSASTSSAPLSSTATSAISASPPTPTPAPQHGHILARVSSRKGTRLRSASSSSAGKRKAFGALVDVLKGVTSMGGAGSGGMGAV